MFKKESPFRPFATDICPETCHVYSNDNETECPSCGTSRFEEKNLTFVPRRTFLQLEVAPQIASLFKNKSFVSGFDTPIEDIVKGNYIKCLRNEHGLFQGQYDIALTLFTDGFQTHDSGGTKLNSVILQVLNIPDKER